MPGFRMSNSWNQTVGLLLLYETDSLRVDSDLTAPEKFVAYLVEIVEWHVGIEMQVLQRRPLPLLFGP